MKIIDVEILNRCGSVAAAEKWWADVERQPLQPLIHAQIQIALSWAEYQELLARSRAAVSAERGWTEVAREQTTLP